MLMTLETPSQMEAKTCDSRITGQQSKNIDRILLALDLGPIKFKLASKDDGPGWSVVKVTRVEAEYRKFLTLCAEMPGEQIVPSKEVDEMWHTHILDTAKYAEDCDTIFGYFLHHFPYLGLRGDEDARALVAASERTKHLYRERFGVQQSRHTPKADCMTGCGDVACSPSSCVNNSQGAVAGVARPTFVQALQPLASADCMTGCGSVGCSPSSCTNNEFGVGNVRSRPTFSDAMAVN